MSKLHTSSRVPVASVYLRRRTSKSYYEPFEQKKTAVEISLHGRKSISDYVKTHKRTRSAGESARKVEDLRRRSCACKGCGGINLLIKMNRKLLESEDDQVKHSIFQLIHKKSNSQLPGLHERLNLVQTLSRYENMVNSIKFKKTMNIPAPSAPTLRKIMTEKNLLRPIEKKIDAESVTKRLYPDVKTQNTVREVPEPKRGSFMQHMRNLSCLQPTKSFLCKTVKNERKVRESFSPRLPRLSKNDTLSDSLTLRINQARSKTKILCELYKERSNPDYLKYNNTMRNKYKLLV